MIILSLDTTATAASVAVSDGAHILASSAAQNGLTHSEIVLPMTEAVLTSAHLTFSDIGAYACTAGPGSFTGVRIGVATVKGLAFGKGVPCVAVSTPEAIAEGLRPLPGIYVAVMDARRGQLYNALFREEAGELVRLTPDRAISAGELAAEMKTYPEDTVFYLAGDGYAVAREALIASGIRNLAETPEELRMQNACAVARVADRMIQRGETTSDLALTPVYLRLSQAERDRIAKEEKEN